MCLSSYALASRSSDVSGQFRLESLQLDQPPASRGLTGDGRGRETGEDPAQGPPGVAGRRSRFLRQYLRNITPRRRRGDAARTRGE